MFSVRSISFGERISSVLRLSSNDLTYDNALLIAASMRWTLEWIFK